VSSHREVFLGSHHAHNQARVVVQNGNTYDVLLYWGMIDARIATPYTPPLSLR
jgi:hypothetical protein